MMTPKTLTDKTRKTIILQRIKGASPRMLSYLENNAKKSLDFGTMTQKHYDFICAEVAKERANSLKT